MAWHCFICSRSEDSVVKVYPWDRLIAVIRIYVGKNQGVYLFPFQEKLLTVIQLCIMVDKYSSIIEIIEYKIDYAIYLPP